MKFTKRELAPKSEGGSSLFVRLKDGESVTGVCKGEVYEFHQVWENGKSQVVGESHPDAKSRFRLNLIVQEDGKFVSKIFEFGLMIYNQLADIAEEYELEKTKIKITRRGTGTDTSYMILPILKEPLGPKALAEIDAVELKHLEHKPQVKNFAPQKTGTDDDDLPF